MRVHAAVALLLLAGCAATPTRAIDPTLPQAVAVVSAENVAPAPGSVVTDRTVFSATVRYSIENFQPGADYYVSTLFDSNKGGGRTFNEVVRFTDSPRITTPSGEIEVRYPIRREMRSAQLARPVRIWLYVMERTGETTTRVIGRVGPYEYATANP